MRRHSLTHNEILKYLMRQNKPITVNRAAREFGLSRISMLVRIDTLTFQNPQIAEDDKGRVYLIKENEGVKL